MPELPEIETLRKDLLEFVIGKQILRVAVSHARSVRAHRNPADFERSVEGSRFVDVKRKGKFLSFTLEASDISQKAVVAHMGMSGQLRRFHPEQTFPPHSHIKIELSDGTHLIYVDPRTFGQFFVEDLDGEGLGVSLQRLGIDPIMQTEDISCGVAAYRRSRIGVKWLLLDQSKVCGIGNMYADEILFRAGIRFDRPGSSLTDEEVARLSRTIYEVLTDAIVLRGSTLKDLQYRDVKGNVGGYQAMHLAYGREGLSCYRCKHTIIRVVSKGRSSYLCTSCQC